MWKDLNFQLFCFCYSLLNVGSVFTEAQPGPTLTALCFEIAHSLLRNIVEREFQILTLMNFHEPLQIKCNFQQPSSSDLPLKSKIPKCGYFLKICSSNFIFTLKYSAFMNLKFKIIKNIIHFLKIRSLQYVC